MGYLFGVEMGHISMNPMRSTVLHCVHGYWKRSMKWILMNEKNQKRKWILMKEKKLMQKENALQQGHQSSC
jgi:hypothetical protein